MFGPCTNRSDIGFDDEGFCWYSCGEGSASTWCLRKWNFPFFYDTETDALLVVDGEAVRDFTEFAQEHRTVGVAVPGVHEKLTAYVCAHAIWGVRCWWAIHSLHAHLFSDRSLSLSDWWAKRFDK